ncbi:hypothetical protein C8F04DRAFT_1186049 [Mycena alexandri]|uniref:Uncharacterized protein n=1 Tax=Mycena alexandri TaxID=1745969 RepID=A0AAD6SPP4_9AGAR|nr:hypothetical protein C8F04DRAFT_1186049 [Mycena alexandri]
MAIFNEIYATLITVPGVEEYEGEAGMQGHAEGRWGRSAAAGRSQEAVAAEGTVSLCCGGKGHFHRKLGQIDSVWILGWRGDAVKETIVFALLEVPCGQNLNLTFGAEDVGHDVEDSGTSFTLSGGANEAHEPAWWW